MENDDVTVCSDDFLMDDDDLNDSVNLLKDFDLGDLENDGNVLESDVIEDQNKNLDSVQVTNYIFKQTPKLFLST